MSGPLARDRLERMVERHGRIVIAYDHGAAKPWIVELGTDGRSISLGKTLAEAVRVSRIPRPKPKVEPPPNGHWARRRFDHDEAARLYADGVSQAELGRRYGVCKASLSWAIKRVRERNEEKVGA